jgi:hypothetical protein
MVVHNVYQTPVCQGLPGMEVSRNIDYLMFKLMAAFVTDLQALFDFRAAAFSPPVLTGANAANCEPHHMKTSTLSHINIKQINFFFFDTLSSGYLV